MLQQQVSDSEQPKVLVETPSQDNDIRSHKIVIEAPSERDETEISRNRVININSSMRSSVVKNKAPSIMSGEDTPIK